MSMDGIKQVVAEMAKNAGPAGIEKIKIAKAIRDKFGFTDWATPFGAIRKLEEEGVIHSKDYVYAGAKPTYTPSAGGGYNSPPVAPELLESAKADVLAKLTAAPANRMFKDLFTRTVETRNAYNQAIQALKTDGKIVFFKDAEENAWVIALRVNRVVPASLDPVMPSAPPAKVMPNTDDLPF